MPDSNLFDIKKRITAATQTRKITRTMELIASSRLQKGKQLLAAFKPWLEHMRESARCLPVSYFEQKPDSQKVGRKALVVFGGSKGLSGAYSSNLQRYAEEACTGQLVLAVGSATEAHFSDAYACLGDSPPSAELARTVTRTGMELYENMDVSEVGLIYMRGAQYINKRLLPLEPIGAYDELAITEPSALVLYPALHEEYAVALVYEAHLEAYIAEQVSRISAMDSATQNADEIIENLQSSYNRIRQASITQEIILVSNAAKGDEQQE